MFKKLLLVLITLIILLPHNLLANDVMNDIKCMCRDEWPDNYRMQKYCIDRQINSYDDVVCKYVKKYFVPYQKSNGNTYYRDVPEEGKIIFRCYDEWTDKKGRKNWRMIKYCCDKQFKAFNSLKNY